MKGYVTNIEKLSLENGNFRKVLYTDFACRNGVVHKTKAEGDADTEHFDGKTTE